MTTNPVTGTAAGVPYLAVPPLTPRADAPVVVAWHLLDPPRTETAFAAALPLTGVDAWRIYLGLPLSGARMPAGGFADIMALAAQDVVANLHGPIALDAVAEFGPAFAELRDVLDLGHGPLALVGGSMGALVAFLVAAGRTDVTALVLVSPLCDLRRTLPLITESLGTAFTWTPATTAIAEQLDAVTRAPELAAAGAPAVLTVTGSRDAPVFLDLAAEQQERLRTAYRDASRLQETVVEGMGHGIAEEPGMDPAPQTEHAAAVDAHAVAWLTTYLPGS